jgi:MazG family protein
MSDPITRLREIMHVLRAPGGCPWDREQTHESLIPSLIEEAYETAAAIRSKDPVHLEEELGDLLLQVVFHAELGTETGAFDFDSICNAISEKLVRRHPHVFGDSEVSTSEGVLRQWDQIKAQEKVDKGEPEPRGFLDKVGVGFPALLKAHELQKKVARVGFDWPDADGACAKVREELSEVDVARDSGDRDALAEELGDLLFAAVNLIRKEGFSAEALLDGANQKFASRFHTVESGLRLQGKRLDEATLDEMEDLWQKAKKPAAP